MYNDSHESTAVDTCTSPYTYFLLVPERLRVLNPVVFFLRSKSASTDWLRNNKHDVASRRKLAPRRRSRVVRALASIPESPEFESHCK